MCLRNQSCGNIRQAYQVNRQRHQHPPGKGAFTGFSKGHIFEASREARSEKEPSTGFSKMHISDASCTATSNKCHMTATLVFCVSLNNLLEWGVLWEKNLKQDRRDEIFTQHPVKPQAANLQGRLTTCSTLTTARTMQTSQASRRRSDPTRRDHFQVTLSMGSNQVLKTRNVGHNQVAHLYGPLI